MAEIDHQVAAHRAVEHNEKAFNRVLHEAGYPAVVCRFVSQFTGYMHNRTLTDVEKRKFRGWARDHPSIDRVHADHDGEIYRVNV